MEEVKVKKEIKKYNMLCKNDYKNKCLCKKCRLERSGIKKLNLKYTEE